MAKFPSILVLAAAATQVGATDCGQALRDSGFDLWCGSELCAWKVERGSVQRVATWNDGDPGVELLGSDAAIEQLSPVDSSDGDCLEFDLLANIDPDADVQLNVDVLGDGTIEHTERLPTSNWKPLSYQIAIKAPYAGVRFELAKTGVGHAVLANIGAKIVMGCAGLQPIVATNVPLGAPCSQNADCASGLCGKSALTPPFTLGLDQVCIACDTLDPCSGPLVCGAGDPTSPVRAAPTECVSRAARQLGEACASGAECATGICAGDVCSTCQTGCGGGETCGPAWTSGDFWNPWKAPQVCSPGGHRRTSSEPCATDDDCASAHCNGAVRMQCDDGRACGSPADCPFKAGTLQNGPCTTVGIQGGSCQ